MVPSGTPIFEISDWGLEARPVDLGIPVFRTIAPNVPWETCDFTVNDAHVTTSWDKKNRKFNLETESVGSQFLWMYWLSRPPGASRPPGYINCFWSAFAGYFMRFFDTPRLSSKNQPSDHHYFCSKNQFNPRVLLDYYDRN